MVNWFKKENHRKYLYRVLSAGSLILVGKGVITSADASLYLGFIVTALGFGLADANTNRGDHGDSNGGQ